MIDLRLIIALLIAVSALTGTHADEPLPELGGLTPLESADTPNMDQVAREGRTGLVSTKWTENRASGVIFDSARSASAISSRAARVSTCVP